MEETTAILISQYRWSPLKKCFQELCGCDFLGLVGSGGEGEKGHRPMGARLRPEASGDRTRTFLLVTGKELEEHIGCREHPRQVPHEPHASSQGGFGVMAGGWGQPLTPLHWGTLVGTAAAGEDQSRAKHPPSTSGTLPSALG